ncbi:uncharacterized protein LOC144654616 [Oculina patagonica]
MKLSTLLFVLLLVFLLEDVYGRGGRGGGRSGGSRGGRSRGRTRSSKGGSSSKPKITKFTPIKATSVRSPVIVSQTKIGPRSSLFTGVVAGYVLHRYLLSNAPVYRVGFPMYGSYVTIPKDRAVRLSSEEERLLDNNGELCLGITSKKQTLRSGIEDNLVELNTTVIYKASGNITKLYDINNTVSLEDIKEKDFAVTTRARYNITIVDNSDCTQVEKTVKGTMVQLYETNPNGASTVNINIKLFATSMTLFGFLTMF